MSKKMFYQVMAMGKDQKPLRVRMDSKELAEIVGHYLNRIGIEVDPNNYFLETTIKSNNTDQLLDLTIDSSNERSGGFDVTNLHKNGGPVAYSGTVGPVYYSGQPRLDPYSGMPNRPILGRQP